jgi:hypothetical protein
VTVTVAENLSFNRPGIIAGIPGRRRRVRVAAPAVTVQPPARPSSEAARPRRRGRLSQDALPVIIGSSVKAGRRPKARVTVLEVKLVKFEPVAGPGARGPAGRHNRRRAT